MTSFYSQHPWPPSLWTATAKAADPVPALQGEYSADVVVIGAGFTGLSTALHLAEQGVAVCVLDAEQPGWGASGRNGGQVIPGLKYDPDELESRFGDHAQPVLDMAASAADVVFDLIDKYQIDCQPVRKGWIQTANSSALMATVEKRARQWERRGVSIEILDERAITARTGAQGFVGGWVDYRAGGVQPLNYVRGLLRAAQQLGAAVYGNSRATAIEKEGKRWRVRTAAGGSVVADHVVIGTNGYTDGLWPGLERTLLTANSYLVATRPLSEEQGASILPGGEVSSDSRRLLVYFRRDDQGRLVLGGRGPRHEPRSESEWAHIERGLQRLFPHLKGVAYEYRWAGRIAMTADFLPHVHEPEAGIHILLGYNGRGVALATCLGMHLANRIASDGASAFPYPVTGIKPIPMHVLQGFYMAAGVTWYRFLDALS